MKRQKRLTRRERKALGGGTTPNHHHGHIHCIACGRHLDPTEFQAGRSQYLTCQHGSQFPSCTDCVPTSTELIATHDRTGEAVRVAGAWH